MQPHATNYDVKCIFGFGFSTFRALKYCCWSCIFFVEWYSIMVCLCSLCKEVEFFACCFMLLSQYIMRQNEPAKKLL